VTFIPTLFVLRLLKLSGFQFVWSYFVGTCSYDCVVYLDVVRNEIRNIFAILWAAALINAFCLNLLGFVDHHWIELRFIYRLLFHLLAENILCLLLSLYFAQFLFLKFYSCFCCVSGVGLLTLLFNILGIKKLLAVANVILIWCIFCVKVWSTTWLKNICRGKWNIERYRLIWFSNI
jgi:hypothetical protein